MAVLFYPHLGPQNHKARYDTIASKEQIRSELGLKLEKDEDLKCENDGAPCSKKKGCDCPRCMQFADLVKAGSAKYGEDETIEELKNKDLGAIQPPLKATPKDKRRAAAGTAKRREEFKKGPLADAQKGLTEQDAQGFGAMTDADLERHRHGMVIGRHLPKPTPEQLAKLPPKPDKEKEKDCASCKYQQELDELNVRYARRGPGILGEEEQRHASRSVEPPDPAGEEHEDTDSSPHAHTQRAHAASSRLEYLHGSVGGYHEHARNASFNGDHELAARHHTLAADSHDAKSATFSKGEPWGADHVASRQHKHAAYLHRVAALAHKYPDEAIERDSLVEANIGSKNAVDARGANVSPKLDVGVVPLELGGERVRYEGGGKTDSDYEFARKDARVASEKAYKSTHRAHEVADADSTTHGQAAKHHQSASFYHRLAGGLTTDHDQKTFHDIMDKHHQALKAHHTDIAELQG